MPVCRNLAAIDPLTVAYLFAVIDLSGLSTDPGLNLVDADPASMGVGGHYIVITFGINIDQARIPVSATVLAAAGSSVFS